MQVHRLINSPVDSNCFVIVGNNDNSCIVIDPGTENCEELLAFIESHNLSVQYCFLTHEHIDHIIGCNVLKKHYPQVKLVCSDLCAKNLNNTRFNLSRLEEHFTSRDSFPFPDLTYSNKLMFEWQGEKVLFLKAMGHSQGSSIALIGENLFVGDTFIYHYKTTTTLPGASRRDLVETFDSLLNDFCNESIIVYPGHFDSCKLSEMKKELLPQSIKIKRILERKHLDNGKE